MGALIAMRYPTKLAAKLADHTYVTCGTRRKAWGCWGGKTGGTELRRGGASTKQADAIAELDERARITCYLINGVCHQAANRILFAANITVRGARGYDVSESLYGVYGRPRGPLGTCKAPFNQHADVTGDLPECGEPAVKEAKAKKMARTSAVRSAEELRRERNYLKGVLDIYRKAGVLPVAPKAEAPSPAENVLLGRDLERFQLELFMHKARYSLGSKLDKSLSRKLEEIRVSTERSRIKIEEWFNNKEMSSSAFVEAINSETILFQEAAAGALKADQYQALFGLKRGDTVILADPAIVKQVYPG